MTQSNPHAPQSPFEPGPEAAPAGKPSGAPRVCGVLSIIFASLFGLFSLIGTLQLGQGGDLSELEAQGIELTSDTDVLEELEEVTAEINLYSGIRALFLTAMSALLLAIGVGQLRYREWARRWTINWSLLALMSLMAMIFVSLSVMGPLYERFFDLFREAQTTDMPFTGASLRSMMSGGAVVLYIAVLAPYPIVLLALFSRSSVKDSMVY